MWSLGTLAAVVVATAVCGSAWNVAKTPPMGWNSWNYWHCGVNATVLKSTADTIVQSGLAKAGYQFVNSDDCWMLAARDANGNQVANPEKFPDGFAAVTAYIHSLNLSSGLYTAKGPNTCAGFAASCDHEYQDAAQWASWGIDYVKDDSCSGCPNRTDNQDYGVMWAAIQASGRPMVLTVEGDPTDSLITLGGYGNAKRVGHDISPNWMSMVSLVDIGSGLWMYAHNSTNATVGGWWNDLDMLEVGNAPDFACSADNFALARCQAHFTMWTIMKAPLIMGNNVPDIDPITLSVLTNADAIAVNQDPWGNQARRVAVQQPLNTTITSSPWDNVAVVRECDASIPTQTWFWANASNNNAPDMLYMLPCDASDAHQQWMFAPVAGGGTQLKNVGSGMCVDESLQADPAKLTTCSAGKSSQLWTLQSSGHIVSATGPCLDIFNFQGPDVDIYSCKTPGQSDANQVFYYDAATGVITANDKYLPNTCLAAASGASGGKLYTVDSSGNKWCFEGSQGVACNNAPLYTPVLHSTLVNGYGNYTFQGPNNGPGWDNTQGSSGPWPHSRYAAGGGTFTVDVTAAQSATGSSLMAADQQGIINDNLTGDVTMGGKFCLDIVTGGMLELWAGLLSGNRWALAVFNRSPGDDAFLIEWSMFNASSSTSYAIRDIWAGKDVGTFTGSYKAPVAEHATTYLILTPA